MVNVFLALLIILGAQCILTMSERNIPMDHFQRRRLIEMLRCAVRQWNREILRYENVMLVCSFISVLRELLETDKAQGKSTSVFLPQLETVLFIIQIFFSNSVGPNICYTLPS